MTAEPPTKRTTATDGGLKGGWEPTHAGQQSLHSCDPMTAEPKEEKEKQPKWRSEGGSESPLMEAKSHFTPVTPDTRAQNKKVKSAKMEV